MAHTSQPCVKAGAAMAFMHAHSDPDVPRHPTAVNHITVNSTSLTNKNHHLDKADPRAEPCTKVPLYTTCRHGLRASPPRPRLPQPLSAEAHLSVMQLPPSAVPALPVTFNYTYLSASVHAWMMASNPGRCLK